MSSDMSGERSTTGRLFKLVCSSFVDVWKLQKLWQIQNFDTQLSVGNYDILTNKLTQMKLTTEQKSLIRQQILMYKTTVYTLVNGRITHLKQQISEKSDITQQYIVTLAMSCCVISPFTDICCFWCVMRPLTSV